MLKTTMEKLVEYIFQHFMEETQRIGHHKIIRTHSLTALLFLKKGWAN